MIAVTRSGILEQLGMDICSREELRAAYRQCSPITDSLIARPRHLKQLNCNYKKVA